MKKLIILTILIISLALTGCALKKKVEVGEDIQSETNNTQPISPTPMDGQEEQGDATQTGNDKIKVFNISDNQTVYSPLTISGQATAFENNLIVELRNSDHETLVKEFTTIKSSKVGEMGDYSITLNFDFKNTKEGFVAVYEQGEDGSELNLVEIPVKFGNLNISTDWQTYKNIDISNWQTYKSEKYGFEVKYPEKWDVFINKDTGITWDNYEIWTEGLVSVFEIKNTKKDEFVGCSSGGPGIPVEGMSFRIVISKKGDKTFNTIINDCIAHSEEGKCETGVEILNGNETLILYDRNTPCNYPSAYVIKKDFVYNIETVWNNMSDRVEYYEELYYEMLNTIKIVP